MSKLKEIIMKFHRLALFALMTATIIFSCNSSDKESQFQNEDTGFSIDTLATGLEIPWGMEFLPDGRILIVEKMGRLRVWADGELQQDAIGGLPEIWVHGQGGLLDVKMHPDYDQNKWLYLAYASPGDGGGNTAIGRGRLENNQLVDLRRYFRECPTRVPVCTLAPESFLMRIIISLPPLATEEKWQMHRIWKPIQVQY